MCMLPQFLKTQKLMSMRFHTGQSGAQDATVTGMITSFQTVPSPRAPRRNLSLRRLKGGRPGTVLLSVCAPVSGREERGKQETRQAGPKDPVFLGGQGGTCEEEEATEERKCYF